MTPSDSPASPFGIPRALAERRAAAIFDLSYRLALTIPDTPDEPVAGEICLEFSVAASEGWPAIDFAAEADDDVTAQYIDHIKVNGNAVSFEVGGGHIHLLADPPVPGRQRIEIAFQAGETGLLRRPGLVYSLHVPARAHRVFPCFDQPDLKAPLTLELDIPAAWRALANAPETSRAVDGGRLRIRFAASEPLPPYLYAFTAGRMDAESRTIDGRELTMLVPAAAADEYRRNADEIYRLHAAALAQLENYTGISYPFAKFGWVLIPDFEFGGMEHPGAIFYRQSLLLLSDGVDDAARTRRANLIAHETAHMWFGNLVTMRWFDDVWLKEVFANFMADKIVAAEYPAVDHVFAFLLRHYPAAYAIERTLGTHPIRQPLDNLAEAGELYDALIYHKAPIAMAELERDIGEREMQRGLQRYLEDFRYANADWQELCLSLQQHTQHDLTAWSQQWIESTAPPLRDVRLDFDGPLAYGSRRLDTMEQLLALDALKQTGHARRRATAWIVLYEDMLDGGVAPARLLSAGVAALATETSELLIERVILDLDEIYWRFLSAGQRGFAASPVERMLWLHFRQHLTTASKTGRDRCLFWLKTLARFAQTPESLAEIESIWRGDNPLLTDLPEAIAIRLACTLALQRTDRAEQIIERQIAQLADAEQRARLEFLREALAPDRAVRDQFFTSLLSGHGRSLWAVAGARLLNHPLRAAETIAYVEPGLEFAAALRRRGEIFLPRQWLEALLSGHGSATAAEIICAFIKAQDHPPRLRQLLLQTADPVFRAARIRGSL